MNGIFSVQIPNTIVGVGAIESISSLVKRFGASRVLVITDPGLVQAGVVDTVTAQLRAGGHTFDVFDRCHAEPSIALVHELRDKVKAGNYDLLVGVGGGSVMDATRGKGRSSGLRATTSCSGCRLGTSDNRKSRLCGPSPMGLG